MNATMVKFGYPETLVCDYRHWCVLLRPAQATLGALVLGAKGEARAFSESRREAFAELPLVTREIERGLKAFRAYRQDQLPDADDGRSARPFPRAAPLCGDAQPLTGVSFTDPGWPGPPDLKSATDKPEETAPGYRRRHPVLLAQE